MVPSASWVIRRKVRASRRPRRRAEVGTACDRVARIRCHSIAPEEIYEILRVLLVREDLAEPQL